MSNIWPRRKKKRNRRGLRAIFAPTKPTETATSVPKVAPPTTTLRPTPALSGTGKTIPKSISISRTTPTTPASNYTAPQSTPASVQEVPLLNTPFTTEQLHQAWDNYLPQLANNGRILSVCQSQYPEIVSENTYSIKVPNPLLQKEMLLIRGQLMHHLHQQLKNNQIQLSIEVNQEMFADIPFTSEEKYRSMVEKNPVLARLKEQLDLMFD